MGNDLRLKFPFPISFSPCDLTIQMVKREDLLLEPLVLLETK